MRLPAASALLALAGAASASSAWTFSDASVTTSSKAAKSVVNKFSAGDPVKEAVALGPRDTIKVSLTTREGSEAKRPHQAFLVVREPSGLEVPFALTVKESGKGTVQFGRKDLPIQLLLSRSPLRASLILGSPGSTEGSVTAMFDMALELDANSPAPGHEAPVRYGRLAEIQHRFRGDAKNPPRIVSLAFALAVVASVPTLFVSWLALGASMGHATKALASAPVSHATFFCSIVGMECVFFLYYSGWNLFQTLPAMGLVGASAFLSGTKALGEVQRRRVAGER